MDNQKLKRSSIKQKAAADVSGSCGHLMEKAFIKISVANCSAISNIKRKVKSIFNPYTVDYKRFYSIFMAVLATIAVSLSTVYAAYRNLRQQ